MRAFRYEGVEVSFSQSWKPTDAPRCLPSFGYKADDETFANYEFQDRDEGRGLSKTGGMLCAILTFLMRQTNKLENPLWDKITMDFKEKEWSTDSSDGR